VLRNVEEQSIKVPWKEGNYLTSN